MFNVDILEFVTLFISEIQQLIIDKVIILNIHIVK